MTGNTVRTIVIFSIIGLVLAGVAVGGVQLLKARNNTYASVQQAPQKPQESQPQKQPKQEAKSDGNQTNNQSTGNPAPQQPQAPSSQSNQTSPNASPAPAQQPANNQVATTGPKEVATTGPSFAGFVASMLLVMLAIFFGAKVLQARALVRKHLS